MSMLVLLDGTPNVWDPKSWKNPTVASISGEWIPSTCCHRGGNRNYQAISPVQHCAACRPELRRCKSPDVPDMLTQIPFTCHTSIIQKRISENWPQTVGDHEPHGKKTPALRVEVSASRRSPWPSPGFPNSSAHCWGS